MRTLQEQIKEDFSAHFEVVDETIRTIDRLLVTIEIEELSSTEAMLLPLFVKAFKTFKACRFLILEGFGQDALMLSRTLFEILVTLEYIEKDVQNRTEAFGRYYYHRMEEYFKRLREDSPPSQILTSKFNTKKSNKWGKTNIKQRAIQIGRLREYQLAYFQLSEVNHSGAVGLNYYSQAYQNSDGSKFFVFNAGPREIGTADAIHYLVYFFSNVAAVASRVIFPQLTELDLQIRPKLPGELFLEQVKVRLSRILRSEFPGLNFIIKTDPFSRLVHILLVENGEWVDISVDGELEAFITPETLTGVAVQTYLGITQSFDLVNTGTSNIDAWVF